MKKIVKIIIICLLAFMAFSTCASQFAFDEPAFASMGSTGGGGFGGGNTSTGSGGSSSSSDSSRAAERFWNSHPRLFKVVIALLVISGLWYYRQYIVIIGVLLFYLPIRNRAYSIHLKLHYGSNYLITWLLSGRFDLFIPNWTVEKFERALADQKIELQENHGKLDDRFTEVYGQAQFLYSQLLRQRYADPSADLRGLKRYLDGRYYRAMVSEIKLKVKNGTVDDTIVDSVTVEKYQFLDKHLIIAKLDVQGRDTEVQFNADYENSFKRNEWSDYVVFGKTRKGSYKIINLVYGEHFHLNGKDFNQQASLNGDGYQEKRVEPPKK